MKLSSALYCRSYQSFFKLALPLLPYRKPTRLHSVEEVADTLHHHGATRVLLVTDKGIRGFQITHPLEEHLAACGIKVFVYDDTAANPTTRDVANAQKLYLQHDCQALIGFGGGSSIDCAKATGACIARPEKTLAQMGGILKVGKKTPLMIAIPTTAGTGSEATLAAVITDEETRHKYPINDFPLQPDYAVLLPEVTRSLPPHLTATTGLDALTHAIEAYIGRSTTKETREDALTATQLVFDNLLTVYHEPDNLEARRNMLEAAYLAGSAFSRSYVGYIHAVAHSLGGKYNIPHGLANAVLLPAVLDAYGQFAQKQLHELGIAAGVCTPEDGDDTGSARFIAAVKMLKYQLGVGSTLPGIQPEDVPELARIAALEANPLYPVPKLLEARELEAFYYRVMEVKYNDSARNSVVG